MLRRRPNAELEIGLHRLQADAYQVELRFTDPDPENQAEVAPQRQPAALDLAALLTLQHDHQAYGEALTDQLFADEKIRATWVKVKAAVEARGLELRLRLLVGPSAPEFHSLRWELLKDPESRAPLATSEKILFSRFMVSHDWRPVRIRPKAELKALVAVAAPSNLAEYELAEVDLQGEVARASENLQGIEITVAGRDEPLTLEHLVAGMREGIDILYLVCHGALTRRGVPVLYLQDETGQVKVAKGEELARRIADLSQPPRLVVLASCESAAPLDSSQAKSDADAQSGAKLAAPAALAPRLAEAGVPAVLAMQGKISMQTVADAMPVFFAELSKDGQIDRALAVARGRVRERDDAWMPALYLRLKGGRIWYVPGFAGEGQDFEKWKSICRRVHQGKFIPILGPDVGEQVYGTSGELAEGLAAADGFPLETHYRTDLAKVTQYLSINQDREYAQGAVREQLRQQVLARHPDLAQDDQGRSFPKLLDAVVEHRREASDPFRILTQLPCSVYITASTEPLLLRSLKAAGREPKPLFCDWRPTEKNHPREPPYEGTPTPEQPVVYHVFGMLNKPDSLVLTEDDFFDYLIATSTYKLIPRVVRGMLTESSLLFLDFRLDDWTFRVLFRMIMSLEGCADLKQYSHVGAQLDPEEHSLADVERARTYLKKYFGTDRGAARGEPEIDIYWGTATDFVNQLRVELDKTAAEEAPVTATQEDDDDWF